jgi:hypothetical protein
VPVLEVLKRQPKQVIPPALLRLPEQGPGFIVGTFIFTYATTVLGQSRNFVLMAVITQTAIGFVWVVCAGTLSDYVGRKNIDMIGAAFMAGLTRLSDQAGAPTQIALRPDGASLDHLVGPAASRT